MCCLLLCINVFFVFYISGVFLCSKSAIKLMIADGKVCRAP